MYVLRIPRNSTNVKLPLKSMLPLEQVPNSFDGPGTSLLIIAMADDQQSLVVYDKRTGTASEIALSNNAPASGHAAISVIYAYADQLAAWWLRLPDEWFADADRRHIQVSVYGQDVNGTKAQASLCVEIV